MAQLIARGAQVGRSFDRYKLELELSTGNFTMFSREGPYYSLILVESIYYESLLTKLPVALNKESKGPSLLTDSY